MAHRHFRPEHRARRALGAAFLALLLAGCAPSAAPADTLPPTTVPAEACTGEAAAALLGELEGTWVLELPQLAGQVPGDCTDATLEFYYDAHHQLRADYAQVLSTGQERRVTELTVRQLPETADTLSAFLLESESGTCLYDGAVREEYTVRILPDGRPKLTIQSQSANSGNVRIISQGFLRPEDRPAQLRAEFHSGELCEPSFRIDPEAEMAVWISIRCDRDLDSAAVISLALNEQTYYLEKEALLQEIGPLPADTPLYLKLAFPGSIPNRGITITHGDVTRTFALLISGYDGSLFLEELTV